MCLLVFDSTQWTRDQFESTVWNFQIRQNCQNQIGHLNQFRRRQMTVHMTHGGDQNKNDISLNE
jgi:hypothetical protein